jgi:regulator of RNase E activity RraB
MTIDITNKLSILEQKEILYKLLGFEVNDNGVIYDEDGNEFYAYDINDKFDLTTIIGICNYIKKSSFQYGKIVGKTETQQSIKNLLDI